MKQLATIILSILFVLTAHSQVLNEPNVVAGDFFTMSIGEPLPVGDAGENMVWDYSQAQFIQNYYGQYYLANTSTFQEDFPNSEWVTEINGGEYYYTFGPDIYEYYGGVEGGISYPYADSEEFYPFPFEYGQTHLDSSYNQLNIQGVLVNRTIITNSAFDGYGTLNLPNQVSYDDVCRISLYRFIEDISKTGTTTMIVDQTLFMQNGIAIPLVAHSLITINTDGDVMDFDVMEFLLSYTVDAEEMEEDQFAMFPNPASDRVTLKWFAGESSIDVYDAYGRVVERIQPTPGFPVVAFDVSGWEAGVYTVSLTKTEGNKTKKLVVE